MAMRYFFRTTGWPIVACMSTSFLFSEPYGRPVNTESRTSCIVIQRVSASSRTYRCLRGCIAKMPKVLCFTTDMASQCWCTTINTSIYLFYMNTWVEHTLKLCMDWYLSQRTSGQADTAALNTLIKQLNDWINVKRRMFTDVCATNAYEHTTCRNKIVTTSTTWVSPHLKKS